MITLLSRLFIKNRGDTTDEKVRRAYGVLCSFTGIGINLVLFALKYIAGVLTGAISITADAFNNLSDAGSSVITLIGFRISGAAPDREHPFGHGRAEYLAGLLVSIVIIVVGVELGRSSIGKILSPEPVDASITAFLILAVSILAKLYMFAYNRALGKKLNAPAMKATALDSLCDAVSTAVVLASVLVARFWGINVDGWCGCAVALFILYTGFSAARDTVGPLLGQPPEPAFVRQIEELVLSHEEIVGIHDLVVHDYGPGRVMISLHAEVPDTGDLNVLHDAVDIAERELQEKLGCAAVIHMDPVAVGDKRTDALRAEASMAAREIDPQMTVHDFRIVTGPTHTNLIFDVVAPQKKELSDEEIKRRLAQSLTRDHPERYCVITVDRSYVL